MLTSPEAGGRVDFLDVTINRLTIDEALAALAATPPGARFRYVVTPNVDHIVKLHDGDPANHALRRAYRGAGWRFCDSRIVARLARLHGIHLPVVTGSDLTARLLGELVRPGDRIAIVGGGETTLAGLRTRYPGVDFIQHMPPMGLRHNAEAVAEAAAFVAASDARFAFIAVGSPQQEMVAHEIAERGDATGIGLCIGASIDFLTGEAARAPRAMQLLGFEWLHRLVSEPRRMWRRYLVEGPRIFAIAARWRADRDTPRPRWPWALALAVPLLLAALFVVWATMYRNGGSGMAGREASRSAQRAAQRLPAGPPPAAESFQPLDLKPIAPEEATAINAAVPIDERANPAAAAFATPKDPLAMARALDCLTSAVYYEAAIEPTDGQRAVAQVVLNRARHPAYPNSVCGVVFQGWERATGCQFTFTCDGAIARVPSVAGWQRARRVAEAALKGDVYKPVGLSTHYHTNWVVPYWAAKLSKTAVVGTHIFYRWQGGWGERYSFRRPYAGSEPAEVLLASRLESHRTDETVAALAEGALPETLPSVTPPPVKITNIIADEKRPVIAADQQAGKLIVPALPELAPAARLAADCVHAAKADASAGC